MAKFCTQCSAPLEENSKFCPGCGAMVAPAQQQPPAQKQGKPGSKKAWIIVGVVAAVAVVAVALVLLLTGKGGQASNADDPLLGTWKADTVEIWGMVSPAGEIFEGEVVLELMSGGKCEFRTPDKRDAYQWTIQGDAITVNAGSELVFSGVIAGNTLTVDDFVGTGMKIVFTKGGASAAATPAAATPEPTGSFEFPDPDPGAFGGQQEGAAATARDVWQGTWFGYMWVTEGFGEWSESFGLWDDESDQMYTAYMVIEVGENGEGTMAIQLEEDDYNMVEAYIYADTNHFEITEGILWDVMLDKRIWWVAPSPVDEGRLLVISDTYIDPELTLNDGFSYMFCFRPFGELWEREQREGGRLPPHYDEYLNALNSGMTDPLAPGGGDSSNSRPTGPVPQLSGAALRSIYQVLKQAYDDSALRDLTYAAVRDGYFNGAEGQLDYESDLIAQYYWYVAGTDEEEYVRVIFQDYGSGVKTAGGIGSNLP